MNDDLTSEMDHQMKRLTLPSFLGESASSEATDNPLTVQLQYEVLFATRDVVAVKHARRKEQFSFFLSVVMKDLLVKSTSAK